MNILIIGGTGTLSAAAAQEAAARGHHVTVLCRGKGDMSLLPPGTAVIQADIRDEADVREKLSSFDCVADFLTFTPEDAHRSLRLFDRYAFISSASVYDKSSGAPITEQTPVGNPYSAYARNKIAAEAVARSRPNTTIIRPSHTFDRCGVPVGLHGHKGSWAVVDRIRKGKPILLHDDGQARWTLTHASDFARGLWDVLEQPEAVGETVNIVSGEALTWQTLYETIAEVLGVALCPVYVPSDRLAEEGAAVGYDFRADLLGDKTPDTVFDIAKLRKFSPHFVPRNPLSADLADTIRAVCSQDALHVADTAFDQFCEVVSGRRFGDAVQACCNASL